MKKRILAMLLSALLVMNISACVSQNEYREYDNNTSSTEPTTTNETINTELDEPPSPSIDIGNESRNSDFSYTVNEDGTVTIRKYYGNDSVLILPDYIDGKPVTEIGNDAFGYPCNTILTSVILNNTLVKIGDNVFDGCIQLKSLTIPESVTSGGYQLYLCDSIEIIYGKKGSFAETCAAKNSINFVDQEINYTREYSKEPVDPSVLDYFACEQVGGYNTFREGSITYDAEVFFGEDRYYQYYAHVPAWDVYFQVPIPEWEIPKDALISREYLFVISANPGGDCVTTYKFSKNGNLVESYRNEFSLFANSHGYNEAWLYNWYQEDLLYAYFLEDTMKKSETTDYVLHKFQSTDHGKTWTQVEADQLEFIYCNIDAFRLFTNDHGVITSEYGGEGDIYVTYDGGGTWSTLELPYPAKWGKLEGFLLKSITYEDNKYIIVLFPYSKKNPSHEITFVSKDFVNWEMEDHYVIDDRIENP